VGGLKSQGWYDASQFSRCLFAIAKDPSVFQRGGYLFAIAKDPSVFQLGGYHMM
jgi:hypothetical protein